MLRALEQIRRIRGGAQSHLMRCDDGYYCVVKFQNNQQHTRVLVNELLGTRLAARLGLPTVSVDIVAVSEELIRLTPELAMELPRARIPCQPGLQFGSRFPGDPQKLTLHDFLPDEQQRTVENVHTFAGDACLQEQDEYSRVRRLHPQADEALLRDLRDDLEDRFQSAPANGSNGGSANWQRLLGKWDETLSNALQLAPQKGVFAADLDAELERLYTDHVALQRAPSRAGAPGSRAQMRLNCSQVFRQACLWERVEKSVRASEFTFPGDPMRLDYSYRRNGTRGFVQCLSVTRAPDLRCGWPS